MNKMLAELRQEMAQLDEAIRSLEHLAAGQGRRRGRPPKWLQDAKGDGPEPSAASAPKRRGRPPGSKNKPKDEEPQD